MYLSNIDVFLKFLHLIPVKTKSGTSVALAFRSIFDDDHRKYSRRPVWVRTDKGKEFLNKPFRYILRDEGIQFQHVRISKMFAKGGEQNFSTEMAKLIEARASHPRTLRFERDSDRGTILPGGTDSGSRLETDRLQDR